MKSSLLLLIFSILLVYMSSLHAQTCPTTGGFATATGPITTTPGNSSCFDRAFSIGDNVTISGLIINGQYTVETCGEPAPSNHPAPYDSYIGIWNAAGSVFLTESLGGTCGNGDDESITFTATATSHLVVLRNEACATGFQLHDLCITYNGLLPVELIDFSVRLKDNDLMLNWATASETNNEKFEIEESKDGREFQKIGEVEGKGTTLEQQDYSFEVGNPKNGISYYRLKQIDFDGQFEYSEIISIDIKGENRTVGEFYPNPSKSGMVNLDYTSQNDDKILVSVLDVTGKLVVNQIQQVSNGDNNLSFDFSDLNTGIYIVKIGGAKKSTHRKIIIEK